MKAIGNRLRLLFGLAGLLCIVHIVNLSLGGLLGQWGIIPRVPEALPFIYTAPFIHGSLHHLLNNLVGILVFSALCMARSVRLYFVSSFIIITLTGVLVWLFGRSASHIGASGWIFGLWSLCIALAWFERSLANFAIAVLVVVLYGGMIFGVLPSERHVSFEAHLFGALSGVIAAMLTARKIRRRRQ